MNKSLMSLHTFFQVKKFLNTKFNFSVIINIEKFVDNFFKLNVTDYMNNFKHSRYCYVI